MREPAPAEVQALADHLCAIYRCRLVDSTADPFTCLVADALQRLHDGGMSVPDRATFQAGYWHTLPALAGPEVAIIGHPPGAMDGAPWAIVGTLIHEVTHAAQIARDGAVPFAIGYLGDSMARVKYEVEALASTDELTRLRGETWTPADQRVAGLRAYACGDREIQVATTLLLIRRATLSQGGSCSPVARDVVGWLRGNAPRCLP